MENKNRHRLKFCVCGKEIVRYTGDKKQYIDWHYTNRTRFCSVKCVGDNRAISKNKVIINKKDALIITKKGNVLISKEDVGKIKGRYWYILANGYCGGYAKREESVYLHRLVMNFPKKGLDVDHINRNILDNRRRNLRIISHGANLLNNGKTGVYMDKYGGYQARVGNRYLGRFKDKEQALIVAKNYRISKIK